MENSLKGKDVLSLKNMTRQEMELIFSTADKLDPRKSYSTLHGKRMALFSSRRVLGQDSGLRVQC